MIYCPKCGTPNEGRFCSKCGEPMVATGVPGATPGYVPPPPPSAQGLGMDENLAAALCYIPIVGLIFLLIDPYKQNRTIRFHAWQSLFYCAAWFVIRIAMMIIWGILSTAMYGMWAVWAMLSGLISLAFFVGLILMAVKAFQRQRFVMPIIGPLAEKQANAA